MRETTFYVADSMYCRFTAPRGVDTRSLALKALDQYRETGNVTDVQYLDDWSVSTKVDERMSFNISGTEDFTVQTIKGFYTFRVDYSFPYPIPSCSQDMEENLRSLAKLIDGRVEAYGTLLDGTLGLTLLEFIEDPLVCW